MKQETLWWQAVDRRSFGKGALAFATLLSMSGCGSEEATTGEALAMQQKHGWNVGAAESRLLYAGGTSNVDATGSADWQMYTDPTRLIEVWKPRTEEWAPFFVPTLLQSLKENTLRSQLRPFLSNTMKTTFERAETLQKDLLSQVQNPGETFFIADIPGPEAVALGAGMAGWADIILGFDNWPHPWGVVRSHETLAALLAYSKVMQERAAKLPPSAPGLLLLDSQRLTPYTDETTQFDNRYIADGLPSPTHLQRRGTKHVMYITADRSQKQESDDLNDVFVEYEKAGIKVSLFPLNDLQKVTEDVKRTMPDGTTQVVRENHYYYGGGLGSHLGFFMMYSLLAPRPVIYYPTHTWGGYGGPSPTPRTTSSSTLRTPTTIQAPGYQPSSRPTMFSGNRVGGQTGVGRARPSGFGQTTIRTSGGRVTGVGARSASSGSSGRSGSFGRGSSGSS